MTTGLIKVKLDPLSTPLPYAAALAASVAKDIVNVEYEVGVPSGVQAEENSSGSFAVAKFIASHNSAESIIPSGKADEEWISLAEGRLAVAKVDFATLQEVANRLDSHLRLNTFIGGVQISLADLIMWGTLRGIPAWNKSIKDGKFGVEVQRWFNHLATQQFTVDALSSIQENATKLKEKKKDQASYEIDLQGAEMGKVVTRFPPEPSGYLHIGHAKAAMLNQYFAEHYKGKLLIRFDDTNPSKEKAEYEQSILEDLEKLGIKGHSVTYSSDYFDELADFCRQMIREGNAYADDTPKETMNDERSKCIASKNRDLSVEESLRIFEGMVAGVEEEYQKFCIRAKIRFDDPNGAMRDPVIFRCNNTPHHRTGTKHKAYPTYDFACPIIDSIEGVTHALRTNEYHDRNPQYYWMIDALHLRKPFIWDYSRMNFVYTLLSKRKLTWFVDQGLVKGWDDPRFPTVRGILRRGLTPAALKEYILMQGPSKNVLLLEWDKLWTLNKKIIDPVAPRYVALGKDNLVGVKILDGPTEPYCTSIPKHKKNLSLGNKETAFSSLIYLEQEDAITLEKGEEITLMDWGNAFVENIQIDQGIVLSVELRLHLEGDFKLTKKKLTWLSPDPNTLINVQLLDYDYLITKKKLDENDKFEDCLTPVTEFITHAIGDANMASLKKGDIIQLERKGFFICDAELEEGRPLQLIAIPDGKVKSISSKNDNSQKK